MATEITVQTAIDLGLTADEFDLIKEKIGRTPNFTELSIFSVMWSEHCSYKNSIKWLKTLPKKGDHLLVEAGEENAGLVDLGDGLACAFKIESHNHPSAIEPYQGAATGVGGIHRDIFTMGARPIAALNSLRFGDLSQAKTKHLLKGVVKGIGDYGNCFGVPTVGGEVYFDETYQTNPLVNAMSVGIVDIDKTISATSYGAGNPVYIVGSSTGKDGIAGAAFASKDITEDSANDLPSVQVGDPFQEKLLLEASLELADTDTIIGMQDMGAAGITCSTSEMSAKEGCGMDIYLDRVPTRQADMKPYEILLSESQERMLVVVKKGREAEVEAIFDKWELNCKQIGTVNDSGILKFYMQDELVAELPAEELVLGGGAPVYEREYKEPASFAKRKEFSIDSIPQPTDLLATAKQVVQSPNIASKKWVSEQYDSMVRVNNTSTNDPSDASVVRVLGTEKLLALSVDCNGKYVDADPYVGAAIAVSEAARNISCSGGMPSAITNCLNFGNPYVPEVYWQFVNAVQGMGAACEQFSTPVTGGNVSFYNQSSDDGPVYPTPTIGMIGVVDSIDLVTSLTFINEGDKIYLLGKQVEDLNCSEYIDKVHGVKNTPAPYFNLEEEHALHIALQQLIRNNLIQSAHDLSEGGLFVSLLESAMAGNMGIDICLPTNMRLDAQLFGEAQGRAVVSIAADKAAAFEAYLKEGTVPFEHIGNVMATKSIHINGNDWGTVSNWNTVYEEVLPKALAE